MEAQDSGSRRKIMPRACHNCRVRKVRCNRHVPCSNCVISGLACPQGTRTPGITGQAQDNQDYLANFVRFEGRLSSLQLEVESLRKQLQNQLSANRTSCSPQYLSGDDQKDGEQSVLELHLQEGESSFGRQALHATQVSELISSESSHSPTVAQHVASLHDMAREYGVSRMKRNDFVLTPASTSVAINIELPSSAFVVTVLRILRELKEGAQSLLFSFTGIHDCAQVEELCNRVYFPLDSLSTGDITIFNGMLSIILRELTFEKGNEVRLEDMERYRQGCEEQFQVGLEKYEVMAMPTRENTMILNLGMLHAQIKAKLPLQWSLASTAARHCLALGYHREDRVSRLPQLEAARVRRLFWHIYIADKNLSSRLGQTSIIQDLDVDVKLNVISSEPGRTPWDQAFVSFVEFARIQGQIYDSLYSPAARKSSLSQRSTIAFDLESQLIKWHDGWTQLDASGAFDYDSFKTTFGPSKVVYYSSLALIHRGTALTGSAHAISSACFEAAHQGLKAHLTYYPRLNGSGPNALSSYAFWIFYYTSFTPFVITFLHCIADSDLDDLQLLREVLDSLEQVGVVLEYAEKQLYLCKALYMIAEGFISSQKSLQSDESVSPGTNTFYLPLHNPYPENWSELDRFLDGAEGCNTAIMDSSAFLLGTM